MSATERNWPIHNPELRENFAQMPRTVFFAPLAADDDWFKTSTVLSAQETILLAGSMTKSVSPNIPVVPVLVITNDKASGETSWTSVEATIVGINQFGKRVVDTVDAVDSSDTWTATFNEAFASLVSITFTVTGGTAADGSDTYIFGYDKEYGLMCNIAASADVIVSTFNGTTDAGTVNVPYNTYTIAGTPDAADFACFVCAPTSYKSRRG